ncbi:MAG: putative lipid II flippase FtsW [Acidobacteria bacterium]|nr:MAG: putative lipid II flippase FtsW [Acidobacteriota bacterium]
MSRKLPYDRTLVVLVFVLLCFGLVMVFSASGIVSQRLHDSFTWVFGRQLAFVAFGFFLMLLAARIDYHWYARPAVVFSALAVTLVLLAAVFAFPAYHGARRWVVILGIRFQPSELAKLAMVIFTSYYLIWAGQRFHAFWRGLVPYLLVLGVNVGMIVLEPDLGTPICILSTAGFLIYLGGLRYRYIMVALLLAVPAFYFLVLNVTYRRNRLLAFLDPEKDPLGVGYHIRQSLIAVGSGGWSGVGYAQGGQKQFFLPEPHNDFIFAVIGEELGLIGTLFTLVLFTLVFLKGVKIALRSDSLFGTYLGLGIVAMITLQALLNMSVVVSLLPTKGIPLPLISVGGTSVLVTLAAIGILLNISRHGRKDPAGPALLGEVSGGADHTVETHE